MPLSVPPVVDRQGFGLKYETANRQSFVDFAFWGGLTPGCLDQMEELKNLGCVAYKGFMSFANPDYPQITDGYLVKGMEIARKFDGLIGVHAENAPRFQRHCKLSSLRRQASYALFRQIIAILFRPVRPHKSPIFP